MAVVSSAQAAHSRSADVARLEAALRYRLEFEALLTDLSTRFIHCPARDIDATISWAVDRLGVFTKVDRCVVFQFDEEPGLARYTHEWCAEGIRSTLSQFAVIDLSAFSWAMRLYREFQHVYVPDVESLPEEARRERELYRLASVKSLLGVPMAANNRLLGILGLSSEREKRAWQPEDIQMLETVAQIFANAIARQRAEAAVARLEDQFRTIADELPVAIAIHDDERFVYANKAAESVSGYRRDEIIGGDFLAFLHPDDRDFGGERMSDLTREHFSDPAEVRFIDRDGQERWLEVRARRIDFEGKPSVLVAANDTTERHRAAEALRRSEEHLRLVLQNMSVLLQAFDAEGNVVAWNGEAERVTGFASAEMVGNPRAMELLYPDPAYRARVLAKWNGRGDEYRDWECHVTCRNGTTRTVSWSKISERFPIPGWALWGVGVDVTDRRRLERQLLEISAREERRIGQDLHDQLGQLLTGIGFKAQLLNQDLQESGSTAADVAGAVVEMVAEAVTQTRRLASGLCPVRLEADGLMGALEDLAAQTSDVFGIACRFVCEEPVLVYDNAVAMHLYRIAQEAVNNAVKHGLPSAVEIRLSSEEDDITLRIRDNGRGFSLPLPEGEGLGLSIMQYRARMLDGSLNLTNAPEGGALVSCHVRNVNKGNRA